MNATNKTQNRKALNDAQKMTIRAALATGATIATLFGAQTIAFFEQQPTATTVTSTTALTTTTNTTVSNIVNSTTSTVNSAVGQPQPRSQSSR